MDVGRRETEFPSLQFSPVGSPTPTPHPCLVRLDTEVLLLRNQKTEFRESAESRKYERCTRKERVTIRRPKYPE